MERKKQSSPFAPSSFSSSGAGRTGYIATAQLGPMQQNFSHRGKTFSANAIAQSEAIAQSVLICSERSIHPANPTKYCEQFFGKDLLGSTALLGDLVSSLSRRLAQVFYSDIPYRVVSFIWDFLYLYRFVAGVIQCFVHFSIHILHL